MTPKVTRVKPLVLLIEDEGLITRMYSKKLELDGYDFLIANNGDDGMKQAIDTHPDLIMCDVMMPVKDGISTLQDLKANDATKDIPVIMLSNVSDDKYIEKTLEMGAVTYLIKSQLVPADVVAKVKEVLDATGKKSLLAK